VPPTLRFVMDGEMPDYLLAKDLILQVRSLKIVLACLHVADMEIEFLHDRIIYLTDYW
jgi:hypothetical protein